MAAKEIIFSTSARSEIAKGLNLLANAVKVTLGPRGRNVVIEKSWGSPDGDQGRRHGREGESSSRTSSRTWARRW